MDNLLEWDNMAREQQINISMEKEAAEALEKAVENDEYIRTSSPMKAW